MSFPFSTSNLPKPIEEELKVLMAIIMQNSLMIQQLQLMVAVKQKEIEEEESREKSRQQKEKEREKEKEKQSKLREEEIRRMEEWIEQESRAYVKRYKGYQRDTRCRKCSWFGHMAHYCRKGEIEAEKEQRGGNH